MFRLVLLILSIAVACAACGLKGSLYLPEKKAPVVITPASDSAVSSSSSSDASLSSQAAP